MPWYAHKSFYDRLLQKLQEQRRKFLQLLVQHHRQLLRPCAARFIQHYFETDRQAKGGVKGYIFRRMVSKLNS
jgi:hypothetical protein